jgi:hypothetical protein
MVDGAFLHLTLTLSPQAERGYEWKARRLILLGGTSVMGRRGGGI